MAPTPAAAADAAIAAAAAMLDLPADDYVFGIESWAQHERRVYQFSMGFCAGLLAWEWLIHLPGEIEIWRRRPSLRRQPAPILLLVLRWSCLGLLCTSLATAFGVHTSCQASIYSAFTFFALIQSSVTILYYLRVCAVWDWDTRLSWAFGVLGAINCLAWFANIGSVHVGDVPWQLAPHGGRCLGSVTQDSWRLTAWATNVVFDSAVLFATLWRVRHSLSDLPPIPKLDAPATVLQNLVYSTLFFVSATIVINTMCLFIQALATDPAVASTPVQFAISMSTILAQRLVLAMRRPGSSGMSMPSSHGAAMSRIECGNAGSGGDAVAAAPVRWSQAQSIAGSDIGMTSRPSISGGILASPKSFDTKSIMSSSGTSLFRGEPGGIVSAVHVPDLSSVETAKRASMQSTRDATGSRASKDSRRDSLRSTGSSASARPESLSLDPIADRREHWSRLWGTQGFVVGREVPSEPEAGSTAAASPPPRVWNATARELVEELDREAAGERTERRMRSGSFAGAANGQSSPGFTSLRPSFFRRTSSASSRPSTARGMDSPRPRPFTTHGAEGTISEGGGGAAPVRPPLVHASRSSIDRDLVLASLSPAPLQRPAPHPTVAVIGRANSSASARTRTADAAPKDLPRLPL